MFIVTEYAALRTGASLYIICSLCNGFAGLFLTFDWTYVNLEIKVGIRNKRTISRVGISGTTAKSRQRKFVPSSHTGPVALVASSRKSQTKVGTLACFEFL